MNSNLLEVHAISTDADPRFAELVKIYTEAHPASERKSVEALAAMIDRPEYLFTVATHGNQVIGFSIVLRFTGSDGCLLEYMAVTDKLRGQGVGRFLFSATVKNIDVAERYVLAEVDSDKTPSADSPERTRRKGFYRSLGLREVEGLNYIMPKVSTATPPTMDLLVYKEHLPAAVERSRVRNWLECCYVQVYERPANDDRIDVMLKDSPANLRLI